MKTMSWMMRFAAAAAGLLFAAACGAAPADLLKLHKVSDHAYAVVGPFGNRSAENLGNNATFGFVVTDEGVVLVDSGGSYQGAQALDAVIRQVTTKPVKVVINTGGQDHRWLGNGYFKERGARIIASRKAVEDQRLRVQEQLMMLGNLVGEAGLKGTEPVYADEQFDERTTVTLGGITLELRWIGPAHTPGDALVWLAQERVAFAGDVVFVGRMLGVQSHSHSGHWVEAFEKLSALDPAVVVPGHGPATPPAQAKADTLDYLVALREQVGRFMKEGGNIAAVGSLDQSRFSHLADYDTLKGRNAQQVYQEMEWD